MQGIILLAAGGSTRLGWPKQLIRFKGKTFIARATEIAVRSNADIAAVVIGGYATSLFSEIEMFPVRMVYNQHFDNGVSTSICKGIESLAMYDLNGAVFMNCDQPYISTAVINSLLEKGGEKDDSIVACTYNGSMGAPAYFGKKYFPELLHLHGKDGIQTVMDAHKEEVRQIDFPFGVVNIDTANDYEQLLAS